MAKKQFATKDWWKMTDSEREAEFAEHTRRGEVPLSETRAPTKAELARLARKPTKTQHEANHAKKNGKPKSGAARVQITIEFQLLDQMDAYAKRHKLSRSELVARGVRRVITSGLRQP